MRKKFFCIDAHTCGNPVRLVASGGPSLEGKSMMEKRRHFLRSYDWIRKGLMFEPRGHDMMSGSILYPPSNPAYDIGILFIETSGCLPMCGHGTIGSVTIMLEEGLVTPKTPGILVLETPAGKVEVSYKMENGRVQSVKLTNIPAFLYQSSLELTHTGLGPLTIDVAYGGNFYAIIDPQPNFSGVQNYNTEQLIQWSRTIRSEMNKKWTFQHPTRPEIQGLSHVLWTGTPISPESDGRNAVFYGNKAIDRSPCGTGTSARMAQLQAKGELSLGDSFVHESYIGSTFTGQIEALTQVGSYSAIIPSIEGWAVITGYNHILIDEATDPYAFGFQVI